MRVIAGSAKRLQLKTLDGMDTRPTTDRIKETLFNMIAPKISGCIFLDLFSGSGSIGIEALSRGAREAVFVEHNSKAVNYIRENLKYTKLEKDAVVITADVLAALRRLEGTRKCDYIFMDPPYEKELERPVLDYLAQSELVGEDTIIIVEAALDTDFSYLDWTELSVMKEKKYKTNKHVFIEKTGGERAC